ncbi:hypothetical protein Nepgr_018817 [Nepenthes gracilis]|uniref:Reverse transcriptase domain-containing protein n=1 Tax=Nepenthes gracilis TaxID=150966 RepID=A0AAD3SU84_NEPGR|nr:hypothetical protein Nepgr_018817 [Nepenthes gracilis]
MVWAVLGDFNAIRASQEGLGGNWHARSSMDLDRCLIDCDLMDVCHDGYFYMQNDGRDSSVHIYRKLDRIVANGHWLVQFGACKASFLPPRLSDHSPGILCLLEEPVKKGMFRFNNFLASHPLFRQVVREVWAANVEGVPMFQLVTRLTLTRKRLKQLNLMMGNVHEEVAHTRSRLEVVQNNHSEAGEERRCKADYARAIACELDFLQQKAKRNWLKDGDQCTKVFFRAVVRNCNRNRILTLIKDDGSYTQSKVEIQQLFLDHFTRILGAGGRFEPELKHRLRPFVLRAIPFSMREGLYSPISAEDIQNALYSIGETKAPAHDGFSSKFFKESWDIVGPSVVDAVQDFFTHGRLLKQINATCISLIPKVKAPSKVGDFRPISCCNVVYKIISKIIANRIKNVLPYLVDSCQNVFVPGRRISDNILLAQELLHNYHSRKGVWRCALKVDLMKTYDSVQWDFLIVVLELMEFPPQMTRWF